MVQWITPKTDWVATDFINVEDFNRIRNNVEYLKSLSNNTFVKELILPPVQSIHDYPYVEIWNQLIHSLCFIHSVEIGGFREGINGYSDYEPYGNYVNYHDLNVIEKMCQEIKDEKDKGYAHVKETLKFILGKRGGIRN